MMNPRALAPGAACCFVGSAGRGRRDSWTPPRKAGVVLTRRKPRALREGPAHRLSGRATGGHHEPTGLGPGSTRGNRLLTLQAADGRNADFHEGSEKPRSAPSRSHLRMTGVWCAQASYFRSA